MNKLKLVVLALAFIFLLITSFVELPALLNKVIYSVMGIFAILFLLLKQKELNLRSIFRKDSETE